MNRTLAAAALTLLPTLPVFANEFAPISELPDFLAAVEGRELRLGMLGLAVSITADGQVNGSASGWPVTGTWSWQEGLFCRELDWGGTPIPYNCQLVEVRNDDQIRFTVDGGTGDSATFNLR